VPGLVALVVTLCSTACGGGGGDGGGSSTPPTTVVGLVTSMDAARYCVTPAGGSRTTCVAIPDARTVAGVDVGRCVETTADLTSDGSRVRVLDDTRCAP